MKQQLEAFTKKLEEFAPPNPRPGAPLSFAALDNVRRLFGTIQDVDAAPTVRVKAAVADRPPRIKINPRKMAHVRHPGTPAIKSSVGSIRPRSSGLPRIRLQKQPHSALLPYPVLDGFKPSSCECEGKLLNLPNSNQTPADQRLISPHPTCGFGPRLARNSQHVSLAMFASKKEPSLPPVRRLAGQSLRDERERLIDDRLAPLYFATVSLWAMWIFGSGSTLIDSSLTFRSWSSRWRSSRPVRA